MLRIFERPLSEVSGHNFNYFYTAIWNVVVTMTTVGYGDVYPITMGGRIFTFLILLIGLGIVAIPTGIISSSLTKVIEPNDEEE